MDAYPKSHLKMAVLAGITLAVLLTALPARESPQDAAEPISLAIRDNEAVPAPAPMPADAPESPTVAASPSNANWQRFKTRRGDSLSALFERAGLSPQDLHAVMQAGGDARDLRDILPGKTVAMQIDTKGNLEALKYKASPVRDLLVTRTDSGSYQADWQAIEPKILLSWATGAITADQPSLYQAAKRAGLSDKMIMNLADIFQWDISFALDLRPGDTFTVLYEERYVDGQKIGNGDIVAAEFSNGGKTYKATLYRDSSGRKSYYAPDGTSMRKAFLRDPVHFSYISSGFNPHRMHPIFHRIMPHWGVDLVAKKGTPVRATGDGRVAIARQNSASGRYIVLRHGREYTTKYLHLSRFARGIRPGKIVKQGQVIGYVGQSGWATAPHLHYEFLVDGVHRNPRTVPLPKAAPIDGRELSRFHAVTGPLLARLDSVSGTTGYAYAAQAAKGAAVK